jgi:hypothetical protein
LYSKHTSQLSPQIYGSYIKARTAADNSSTGATVDCTRAHMSKVVVQCVQQLQDTQIIKHMT